MPVSTSDPATRPHPAAPASGGLDRSAARPLFEQLADRIEALIDAGTLAVGEQAPSIRRARQQFGVSAATVVEAYKLLEARGRLRARPQSGYYVRPRASRERPVPAMTAPALRSVILEPTEPMLIRLKAAVPDASLLPVAALTRLLARVYRDHPETVTAYGPTAGCESLRREIARRMMDAGCTIAPDDVIVTNGATEAVHLALQTLTAPGDTVAVESPTYHGLLDTLRARGLKALPIASCTVGGISVSALENAVAKRRVAAVVLVANFTNPLGGLMPDDCRRTLIHLAQRHGIPIIEDDVYGELCFTEPRPRALRAEDDGSWIFHCSSFSKVLSPGMRIGWCVPGKHYDQVLRLKNDLNVATPVGPQLAVAEFLASGGFDRHLRHLRRTYRTLVEQYTDRVLTTFPPGTRTSQPRGGHVLWVEMPEPVDSLRLLEAAHRERITFAPGPQFAPDDAYRNFLRLNCAVPWSDAVADAIATLGRLAYAQVYQHAGAQIAADGRGNGTGSPHLEAPRMAAATRTRGSGAPPQFGEGEHRQPRARRRA